MIDNQRTHNLSTIRMIQISLDISGVEMAQAFEVTTATISAVKLGTRNFKLSTLKNGLQNLGISLTCYAEIEEFREYIEQEPIDNYSKNVCMLAKTIGTIYPQNKDLAEMIITRYLTNPLER